MACQELAYGCVSNINGDISFANHRASCLGVSVNSSTIYLQDCFLVDGERKTSVSIGFICVHVVLITCYKLKDYPGTCLCKFDISHTQGFKHAVMAQFNSAKPADSSEMAKNQSKISHVLYTVSLRSAGRKRTVHSK